MSDELGGRSATMCRTDSREPTTQAADI